MTDSSSYRIRPITPADEPFLWEMLYEALYVPEGSPPFPREVVNLPEISRYVRGWGRPDDSGCIAVLAAGRQPIGAAWLRLLTGDNRGYGYVDEATPELTVAVAPACRGTGVGTSLLTHLLTAAKERSSSVSLSVSADNPAFGLYQRLEFDVIGTNRSSITMRKSLRE